jgi:hypothetical protein
MDRTSTGSLARRGAFALERMRTAVRGRLATVVAGALLIVGLAGGAVALAAGAPAAPVGPLGLNPCSPVDQAAGQDVCDTEATPVAKSDQTLWSIRGGALYGEDGRLQLDSPAPFTVDFYAVRFNGGPLLGFAGGAQCKDPSTTFENLSSCDQPGGRVALE